MSGLKWDLGAPVAIAISLAVLGPSMTVSPNPQASEQQVGAGAYMAFLLALIRCSWASGWSPFRLEPISSGAGANGDRPHAHAEREGPR